MTKETLDQISAQGLFQLQTAIRDAIKGRIDRGEITQSQIARKTGISQPHISNTLRKARAPRLWILDQLAEAAGVEVLATITAPVTAQPTPQQPATPEPKTPKQHGNKGKARTPFSRNSRAKLTT